MTEEKRATLPIQSPSLWHGMTAGIWFSLLSRNRFSVSPSRVPMALAISCCSCLNSFLRLLSEAAYSGKAANVAVQQPPLFVIGHWRTGTTWLHELLVKDERMAYPTTYQCMVPHHFLLSDSLLSWLVNLCLPRSRPMDEMPVGVTRPQEDEFALMNLGLGSPYLEWAFPNRAERYDQYLTLQSLSATELEAWKERFDWFIRRLTLHNPNRLVLKSPTHTARVGILREMYPDARFVHVVRNPLDTIPSTIRTWTRLMDVMGLQYRRHPVSADRILDTFERMYEQFEQDRPQIPADRLYEIRYEDLVADPLIEMERIYRQLDLADFEPARPAIEKYLASIAGYQRNVHRVPDDLKHKINSRCKPYIERYGYHEAAIT